MVYTIIGLPIVFAKLEIANDNLVADVSLIGTRTEEMDTVQMGDVNTPIGAHTCKIVQSH